MIFDSALSKIMQGHDGNIPKFMETVLNFLKKRQKNLDANQKDHLKKMIWTSVERNFFTIKVTESKSDEKKQAEDKLKHSNVVVRKKEERSMLTGYACTDCASYYKALDMTEETVNSIVQKCSKHRATLPPPNSPKGMFESYGSIIDITKKITLL